MMRASTRWCCSGLDAFPMTTSGKVQRHACKAGFLKGTLESLGEM